MYINRRKIKIILVNFLLVGTTNTFASHNNSNFVQTNNNNNTTSNNIINRKQSSTDSNRIDDKIRPSQTFSSMNDVERNTNAPFSIPLSKSTSLKTFYQSATPKNVAFTQNSIGQSHDKNNFDSVKNHSYAPFVTSATSQKL